MPEARIKSKRVYHSLAEVECAYFPKSIEKETSAVIAEDPAVYGEKVAHEMIEAMRREFIRSIDR